MVEIFGDKHREAEELCVKGIERYEEKDLAGAHANFLTAYDMDPESPKATSWLGLSTAVYEKKVQKGMELCRKAVDSNVPDVMFFRNIGKCYLLLRNKRAAVGAFARGLQIEKGSRAILDEWKVLGFRRKVAFPFLDRSNFLNKMMGKFTWWLKHRKDL